MNASKSIPSIVAIVMTMLCAFSAQSKPWTVLVSGDSNIINPLTGSLGADIDAGNQAFFRNLLNDGRNVGVLPSGAGRAVDADIVEYYKGIEGVNVQEFSGSIAIDAFQSIDLFVSIVPADAFSGDEIAAMRTLLSRGGTLFFLGENFISATKNSYINSALSSLNIAIELVPDSTFGDGLHSIGPSRIAADNFTVGVSSFTYGSSSQVSGGKVLIRGENGEPFVSYISAIPEASTCGLLSIGMFAIFIYRRTNEKRRAPV